MVSNLAGQSSSTPGCSRGGFEAGARIDPSRTNRTVFVPNALARTVCTSATPSTHPPTRSSTASMAATAMPAGVTSSLTVVASTRSVTNTVSPLAWRHRAASSWWPAALGASASRPSPTSNRQPDEPADPVRMNGRITGPSRSIVAGPTWADHPVRPLVPAATDSETSLTTGRPLTDPCTDTLSGLGCTSMTTVRTVTVSTPALDRTAACWPAPSPSRRTSTVSSAPPAWVSKPPSCARR